MIQIFSTDIAWPGPVHVEEGPDCPCSRCGAPIVDPDIAVRCWPEDSNGYSYRFHPTCLGLVALPPLADDDFPQIDDFEVIDARIPPPWDDEEPEP